MMFRGKNTIDAERDDVSSDSSLVKTWDKNAISDHYKNIACKLGNHFTQSDSATAAPVCGRLDSITRFVKIENAPPPRPPSQPSSFGLFRPTLTNWRLT
mmetsp:Transcript_55413/g.66763  ORF Transcript_55413/g.66763 Transcript_55413/m.66763 type:complete len:99 (+) Transcript_55413:1132-1428(+)